MRPVGAEPAIDRAVSVVSGETAAAAGKRPRAPATRAAIAAFILFLVGLAGGFVAEVRADATAVAADRVAIASALAEPIAACIVRQDTGHPAFHGCIDWHSSVHATWALLAYERATGDERYASLVDDVLDPEKIHSERADLASAPRFEMPYGRAWFLRLSIEHGRTRNSSALVPMADDIAESLVDWLKKAEKDPWRGSYGNQSWALVNLLDYAAYRRDFQLIADVLPIARRYFLVVDRPCTPEDQRGGFMATCLVRAMLAARLFDRNDMVAWIDAFLPALDKLQPVTDPRRAHEYGLNFSRAWGLWDVSVATGRASLAERYAAHVRASYDDPQNWSGDYRKVAHWVAQFGMFAIQPLFGPENYR